MTGFRKSAVTQYLESVFVAANTLADLRDQYIRGRLDLDEYERRVAERLRYEDAIA